MKKTLIMMGGGLLVTSIAMANYVTFIGQNNDPANPAGSLNVADNWDGGSLPSGSSTGLVSVTATVWPGVSWNDLAVRQTGGYVRALSNDFNMRGGTSGSGITTIYEIEDARTDYASYTNLYVATKLAFWSQYGESMELSLLSGHVAVSNLSLNASVGSINVRDGIMQARTLTTAVGTVNMLAGGAGEVVIDSQDASLGSFYLNFETGNMGSFTFGAKDGTNSASSSIKWLVTSGRVSIDGVADTDLASYSIVNNGLSSSIALIPEPATLALVGLLGAGIFTVRRFFSL